MPSYRTTCLGAPFVVLSGTFVTVPFMPPKTFRMRGLRIGAIDVMPAPWVIRVLQHLAWLRVPWRDTTPDGTVWFMRSVGLTVLAWLNARAQRHALRDVTVADISTEGQSMWATRRPPLPASMLVDWPTMVLDVGTWPDQQIDVTLAGYSYGQRLGVYLLGTVLEATFSDDDPDAIRELIGNPDQDEVS